MSVTQCSRYSGIWGGGGGEGTDIHESVNKNNEIASTENWTTVGEVDQASLNEGRKRSFAIISENTF